MTGDSSGFPRSERLRGIGKVHGAMPPLAGTPKCPGGTEPDRWLPITWIPISSPPSQNHFLLLCPQAGSLTSMVTSFSPSQAGKLSGEKEDKNTSCASRSSPPSRHVNGDRLAQITPCLPAPPQLLPPQRPPAKQVLSLLLSSDEGAPSARLFENLEITASTIPGPGDVRLRGVKIQARAA
ncbi:hypothetical protein DPEC_G00185710 [Dallia pectoralis]|uniref:Uncharacterized protein n=1 Tax=Dallia pectoralis TaxID=75939 RepID=A0ACC2GBK8_DALPE|nr:hypothetical protein DPEC_G00185710 [Dallia pectoralis]